MKLFGKTVSKTILRWGGNGIVAAAPGSYWKVCGSDVDLIGNGVPIVGRPESYYEVPFAGVLRNFYGRISAAFGAGLGAVHTIYVNEVATALTFTISGAAQVNNSDLVNTVTVAVGDRVYLHLDRTAGAPPAVTGGCSLELDAA